jgi:TrpR-related protein YerC/YecD
MLERNCTYTEIAETTGASTATISRVKRCLNYGADGYKLILERLKEDENK